MATASDLRLITPEEFLAIDTGTEVKAELDDGTIRTMAGGSREHARVQRNILLWFGNALRGSPCQPYGADAAVRSAGYSIRYPDMVVDCAPDEGLEQELKATVLADPRIIVEVLSPGTRAHDEGPKLHEYRRMPGVRNIVYVDPALRSVRVLEQVGVGRWHDTGDVVNGDAWLGELGLTMTNADIFGRN